MKQIYIIKKILEDDSLSDNAFCVWAALQPWSGIKDDLLFTISYIGYLIYGREITRTETDFVQQGFKELIDRGVIRVNAVLKRSEYVCNIQGLYFEQGTEFFVTVSYDELRKVMNIPTRSNKGKLFRYFVSVVGHFNQSKHVDKEFRGRICGISLESMNRLIPKKTAICYNNLLTDYKLLYIFRSEDIIITDTEITRVANCYSRYEDKDLCIKFAVNYQSWYGWNTKKSLRKMDLDNANRSRSLAQKYNNLCKGKEYDIETVRDIYQWAVNWNRTHIAIYKDELSKGNSPDLIQKDMTVFERYNIKGTETNIEEHIEEREMTYKNDQRTI